MQAQTLCETCIRNETETQSYYVFRIERTQDIVSTLNISAHVTPDVADILNHLKLFQTALH